MTAELVEPGRGRLPVMPIELALSRWYFALYVEDCVQLKDLLEGHAHLVLEGWKADTKRGEKGDARTSTAEQHWLGCTVLHAAVRRGYAELVQKIVQLYMVDTEGEWLCSETTSKLPEGVTRSLGDLLAQKHGLSKLEAVAMAIINGHSLITRVLLEASTRCMSNPYQVDTSWWAVVQGEADSSRRTNIEAAWKKKQIRMITEEAMKTLNEDDRKIIEREYSNDPNFKHLRFEEFLFSFTFSNNNVDATLLKVVQNEVMKRAMSVPSLKDFLLNPEFPQTIAATVGPSDEELLANQIKGKGVPSRGGNLTEDRVREVVGTVTKELLTELVPNVKLRLRMLYSQDSDFNFLPLQEYLFAFTFTNVTLAGVRKRLWEMFRSHLRCAEIVQFLIIKLRDGQGRTVLHVAVDYGQVDELMQLVRMIHGLINDRIYKDWANTLDDAGRTPLLRAVATGRSDSVKALLTISSVDLNAKLQFFPRDKIFMLDARVTCQFLCDLSSRNKFDKDLMSDDSKMKDALSLMALQIAIIHRNSHCVELLLNDKLSYRPRNYRLNLDYSLTKVLEKAGEDYDHLAAMMEEGKVSQLILGALTNARCQPGVEYEPLALAATVGDAKITQLLLEDPRAFDMGRSSKWWNTPLRRALKKHGNLFKNLPALHVAAASGKFDLVKLFVENSKGIEKFYNPFVTDYHANTAMHHVTQGDYDHVRLHLLHFATVGQVEDLRKGGESPQSGELVDKRELIERQGCVQLLLQAGLDVWTMNMKEMAPYPNSKLPPDFLSWWYDKLTKETVEEQNTLNAAANAISVTAALVATASYIGPLQPPLGYQAGADGFSTDMQVDIKWVRMFFVFNTLSFYLAVASIMLAIIPSLPITRQKVRMEIKYTKRIVIYAVGTLFPSIISVILAFASSSMAVVPDTYQSLKVTTVIVGGMVCLFVIYFFFVRLLGLLMHKSARVRRLYGNSIFLDEFILTKWSELVTIIGKKIREWWSGCS